MHQQARQILRRLAKTGAIYSRNFRLSGLVTHHLTDEELERAGSAMVDALEAEVLAMSKSARGAGTSPVPGAAPQRVRPKGQTR